MQTNVYAIGRKMVVVFGGLLLVAVAAAEPATARIRFSLPDL
jgi:hypothetical protein